MSHWADSANERGVDAGRAFLPNIGRQPGFNLEIRRALIGTRETPETDWITSSNGISLLLEG